MVVPTTDILGPYRVLSAFEISEKVISHGEVRAGRMTTRDAAKITRPVGPVGGIRASGRGVGSSAVNGWIAGSPRYAKNSHKRSAVAGGGESSRAVECKARELSRDRARHRAPPSQQVVQDAAEMSSVHSLQDVLTSLLPF